MATAWDVAAIGWSITVLGWLLSPIINLLLQKILSCLGFEASQKLQELKLHIIRELRRTLEDVDEARMLRGAKKKEKDNVDDIILLDEMAVKLRHAQLEAEDILGLVDYHQIERKVIGDASSWPRRLLSAVATCNKSWLGVVRITRHGSARLLQSSLCRLLRTSAASSGRCCFDFFNMSWLGIVRITRDGSTQLLHWVHKSSLCCWFLRSRPKHLIPVTVRAPPSDDILPVDGGGEPSAEISDESSHDEPVPVAGGGEPSVEISHESSHDEPVLVAGGGEPSVEISHESSHDEPVLVPAGGASSVETSHESSDEEPDSANSAAPSDLSGRWLSSWCSSLDFFKSCCRFICYRLVEPACFYRNWSYDWVGITNHQENASTVLDSVLPAISRRNLKKRIERVESTVSEVKKSPLLGIASQSASELELKNRKDILNMNRRNITSSSSEREVFGREELLRDIMQKIVPDQTPPDDAPSSSSCTCYSVIGIYGVAGSGKTTLARYVLDHVKEYYGDHFHTLMCIHVSETFSVDDIFHDMLKDMTKDRHSNISSREELKAKLEENLRRKRFFLILDDLWLKDNNRQEVMELLSPLNVGMKGSKILATARVKDAVRAIGADEPIAISDLDEEQYFKMFMHYALGRTGIHDEKIEVAGRKIAKKLHRSPIAAVTVAGQLLGRSIEFWQATAELDVLNWWMKWEGRS